MAPLAPFREQLLILSGVDNQVYLKGLIDNHNEGMSTLLTGLPAGDLTLPVEMRTTYQANGISLDQHVAAAIGGGDGDVRFHLHGHGAERQRRGRGGRPREVRGVLGGLDPHLPDAGGLRRRVEAGDEGDNAAL